MSTLQTGKKKTIKWELERFINHPDLMIKMLPGNKKNFPRFEL